jgi:hypothetical protein
MDDPVWKELMEVGKKIEKTPVYNTMTEEQLYDTLGTIDYLLPGGVPDPILLNRQWQMDMTSAGGPVSVHNMNTGKSFLGALRPRYRLFDELGMAMQGRLGDDEETKEWAKTLARAYVSCVKEKGVKTRTQLYDCVPKQALKVKR